MDPMGIYNSYILIHFSHPNLNKCHGILLGLWQVIFLFHIFSEKPKGVPGTSSRPRRPAVMQLGYSDQTIGWEFPHFRWWGKYPGIVSQKCPGRFRFRKSSNCPDMMYIYIYVRIHINYIYMHALAFYGETISTSNDITNRMWWM